MDTRLVPLALGSFAAATDIVIVSAIIPLIVAEFDVSVSQAGYISVVFSATYAVTAPVLTAFTVGFERRIVIALSLATFALGSFAAVSVGFAALLAARVLMAAGLGVFNAMAQATAVEIAPSAQRGRSLSVLYFGATLGFAIGAPTGAFIANVLGWRAAYLAIGGIALVAAAAAFLLLPAELRGQRQTLSERFKVVRVPGVVPGLVVSILCMIGPTSVLVYVSALAGGASLSLPLFLLAYGIGAVLGNLVGGRLTDHFGPRRGVMAALLATALNTLAASAIPLLPAPLEATAWLANGLLNGICVWAFYPPQVTWLASRSPPSAPLVLSLNGTAVQTGVALAALLGGVIIDLVGAGLLGLIGGLTPLAAIWIAWASYREDATEP